jgi:hypothetical protein
MKELAKHTAFKIEKALILIEKLELTDEYKLIHLNTKQIEYIHTPCNTLIIKSVSCFLKNHYCKNGKCKEKRKRENYDSDYDTMIKARNKKSHATRKDRGNPGYDKAAETWKSKNESELLEISQKKHNNKINSVDENGLNAYERATIKNKEIKKERYGDENYNNSEKRIETCNDKYGMGSNGKAISEGLLNKSEDEWKEIIRKRQDTNMKLHGSVNAYNETKMKETNQLKRGVDFPSQNPEVIEKSKHTHYTKYYQRVILNLTHVKPLFTIEEYKGNLKSYKFLCLTCNQEFSFVLRDGKIPRCTHCFSPKYHTSKIENEIKDWLKQLNISIVPNKRFYYKGKHHHELDIYIPEKNIGIELNGIYYHSEIAGNKRQNYHLIKTNFFKEKNIQVIHIWDKEWIEKKDIVKSIILTKIGISENKIYARKCIIKEIDNATTIEFLNRTHIQGGIIASINIGLFFNNELVQVCSFSKPRFDKKQKHKYELIRFSSQLNISVIGGFSKCLKYFTQNYSTSLISYADKRFSIGNVYLKNNFILINESSPNYFYTQDYINLYSRIKFQKHKLKNLLEFYNQELTEWENMQQNGWDRIWDCGNYVFEYKP